MKSSKNKDVRSLNDDWTYRVTVLADLVYRRVSMIVQRESGLNISQWRVMTAVADKEGRSASQVADMTPMDKGIVSRAVATLVKKGVLERRASRTDGRLSLLYLTSQGKGLHQKLSDAMAIDGTDGLQLLDAESDAQFIEILDDVINKYTSLSSPD